MRGERGLANSIKKGEWWGWESGLNMDNMKVILQLLKKKTHIVIFKNHKSMAYNGQRAFLIG